MKYNKKAPTRCELTEASKSTQRLTCKPINYHLKATVYRLTPWLFFMGVMHG